MIKLTRNVDKIKPPKGCLPKVSNVSSKIPIQHLSMSLTFLHNLKSVIAYKIDEPLSCNVFKVMCFGDLEPTAVDPSADGFVLVAEDDFHILGRDDVGQVVPQIVEPRAEVFGDLVRVEVVLVRLAFAGVICGKGDGDEILLGMLGAVLYVLVKVGAENDVSMCFLAGVLAGNHSILEHPRALALADMKDLADFFDGELFTCHGATSL